MAGRDVTMARMLLQPDARYVLLCRSGAAELVKATLKKIITVPSYTRSDGRVVHAHQKTVLYNPDTPAADVASGNGSHAQKKAHAHLSHKAWWQQLPADAKALVIMELATDLQAKASASAAVSGWKKQALTGKNPTKAQWTAFYGLPTDKQAALLDEVKAGPGLEHLKAPALPLKTPDAAAASAVVAAPPAVAPPAPEPAPAPQKVWSVAINSGAHANPDDEVIENSIVPPGLSYAQAIKWAKARAKAHGLAWTKYASTEEYSVAVLPRLMELYIGEKADFDQKKAATAKAVTAALTQINLTNGSKFSVYSHSAFSIGGTEHVGVITGMPKNPKVKFNHALATTSNGKISYKKTLPITLAMVAQQPKAKAAAAGPKDGDTKPAADGGTLVFKDGRWHKQEPASGAHAPLPTDAAGVGDLVGSVFSAYTASAIGGTLTLVNKLTGVPESFGTLDSANYNAATLKQKAGLDAHVTQVGADQYQITFGALASSSEPASDEGGSWLAEALGYPPGTVSAGEDGGYDANGNLLGPATNEPVAASSDAGGDIDVGGGAVAALAAMETGPYYQKVALAKLKKDDAWQKLAAPQQFEQAMALYHQLQTAASQAAAVSTAKKAMTAGKVPTKGQFHAVSALDHDATTKIAAAVGTKQFAALMAQAEKKYGAAPASQVAAPAKATGPVQSMPAGVSVATPPAAAASAKPTGGSSLSDLIAISKKLSNLPYSGYTAAKHKGVIVLSHKHGGAVLFYSGESIEDAISAVTNSTGLTATATPPGPHGEKFIALSLATDTPAAPASAKTDSVVSPATISDADVGKISAAISKQWPKFSAAKNAAGQTVLMHGGVPMTYKNVTAWHSAAKGVALVTGHSAHPLVVDGANMIVFANATASAGDGPKDGDTKPGADGMLVFHNGRWHKQDATASPAASAPLATPAASGKAHGKAASSATSAATPTPTAGTTSYVIPVSTSGALEPKSKPVVHGVKATPIAGWVKTSGQLGSNPGGKYIDPSGQQWYVKFPKNPEQAKAEVLAAKLYTISGAAAQNARFVTEDGNLGIASKWVDVTSLKSGAAIAALPGARDFFAVDAWLANHDVIGLDYTNIQRGADGRAVRVDAGGSLMFKAQGAKKPFGPSVDSIDSMRDAKFAQPHAVFGGMSDAEIVDSVKRVLAIKDGDIRKLVRKYGPGNEKAREALANTLIARKQYLAARFPKAAEAPPVEYRIPETPDFANWNGPGHGLSSKPAFNKQNDDIANAIHDAGVAGSLAAVKNLTYQPINSTGEPQGAPQLVSAHSSKHIIAYWKDVQHAMVTPYVDTKAATLYKQAVASVLYDDDLKKFMSLAEAEVTAGRYAFMGMADSSLVTWKPKKVMSAKSGTIDLAALYTASMAAFKKLPSLQQQAIRSYTGSGYSAMNSAIIIGKHNNMAANAALGVAAASVPIPEGTVLSRRCALKKTASGVAANPKEQLQVLLDKGVGSVWQEFGIISTAYTAGTWAGALHMRITAGPGLTGLFAATPPSGVKGSSISSHGSEHEIILPVGTRFMIREIHADGETVKDATGTWGGPGSRVIDVVALPPI